MPNFFSRWPLAILLALPFAAQAQNVGIGTTAPDASAALDIVSSTKGALLPRVADATAIATPANGLIVFQTGGTPGYYYNAGTPTTPSWQQIATAAGAAITAGNGLTKTGQSVALGGALSTPTTIAQAGNNFALTGGSVGIGTAAPQSTLDVSGDFRVSTGAVNSTLGTTGSANANFSGGVGQSFTLPVAASVTSIRLVAGANSFSTTFQIYRGGGPSGTALLATPQPISFTANSSTTVVLPTPLSLAAGTYTLYLNVGSTPIRYFNSGENYTGGNVYSGTSSIAPYDLDFTVAYTSGTATSAFNVAPGGNVGIGTTGTPSQKLDVTGGSIKISSTGSGLIFPDGTTQTTAASAAAAGGATVGDIKQGLQTADHAGWVKLDGRATSTLTTTQQARATTLGIGANLPDATGKVLKQTSSSLLSAGGGNTAAIGQANLPNISLTGSTDVAGAHSHTFYSYYPNSTATTYTTFLLAGSRTGYYTASGPTSTNGDHSHTVTVPLGGSGTALPVEDAYLSVNQFVYLGL